jgi:hypothetical protein
MDMASASRFEPRSSIPNATAKLGLVSHVYGSSETVHDVIERTKRKKEDLAVKSFPGEGYGKSA